MRCAYCIHSTVKNSQSVRNPWLKDTRVFVWKQHTADDETTQRGSSDKFRYYYSRQTSVLLQPKCFMQLMYLQFKLTVYRTRRGTEFPCFTLKFQYSQCDVFLYKRADMQGLKDHLRAFADRFMPDFTHISVNDMWIELKTVFLKAVNKFIP